MAKLFSGATIVLAAFIIGSIPATASRSKRNLRSSQGSKSSKGTFAEVCIIGAGPSGVQAAYSAEKKGLTTALFEKNTYIGGKTKAINTNSPYPYLMGAPLYSLRKHSSFQNLIEEFSIHLNDTTGTEREIFIGNTTVEPPTPTVELQDNITEYVRLRNELAPKLDNPSGLLSDYGSELHVSLLQWLSANDLMGLFGLFWLYCTTFGYGHPSNVPAIYALKYLQSELFLDFVNVGTANNLKYIVFQSLLESMVNSLDGDIFIDTEIEDVSYEPEITIIKYRTNGRKSKSINCGSTIIAFPPTAIAMRIFTPPHAPDLVKLFEEVKTFDYATILYEDESGDFASGQKASYRIPSISGIPDDPAVNLLYFKQQDFMASSVTAYYFSPSKKTDDEALNESLEAYGTKIGQTVTSDIVGDFNRWPDYFPHVNKESLDNGFYQKFESFQGYANQYYVGALFNFEMVQDAMQHAEYIVASKL